MIKHVLGIRFLFCMFALLSCTAQASAMVSGSRPNNLSSTEHLRIKVYALNVVLEY